ncbi:hypothetical protein [Phycicoccus sp.]|uniref:hypothetical protein n=1 Tax=Phycicoccus sp. TaxID=1902410 RepID=UPI002BE19774|nr:hypothetical protein [Phycicoccus sp.]HMM93970.1 hypothetical protein [Phycicoccus sp.]
MSQRPEPWKTLSAEFRQVKEELRQLRNRSPFAISGLQVTAEDEITAYGNFIVTGDFTAEGKIYNDALVDPVVPAVYHQHQTGFTVSTASTPRAVVTIAVPTGYTRAMVTAAAAGQAFNGSGSLDYLAVTSIINGDSTYGIAMQTTVPVNELRNSTHVSTALLTGLSGSFQCYAYVASQVGSWGSTVSGNGVNVDVTVLFLR